MKIVFMIVFYIITFIMLITYLFKEKYVSDLLDRLTIKVLDKIKIERKDNKLKKYILFINIVAVVIFFSLVYKIDFTPSEILPIKNRALYVTLFMNILFIIFIFLKKYYLEYGFLINIVMIIFGQSMFGIEDKYYYILIYCLVFIYLILIYFTQFDIVNKIKKLVGYIYVIILVLIIQNFYLGNYVIPTGSMEDTILVGDRIFSNNVIYNFKKPQIGDIVAFKEPLDDVTMYTKRVVATPGDLLWINEFDKKIYINLKESNLNREYSIEGLIRIFGNPEVYVPKKGDKVRLKELIEFDMEENKLNLISTNEFLKRNYKFEDYKYIFGIWNSKTLDQVSGIKNVNSRYRYTFILEEENNLDKLILPILDFKYDKKIMTKLLSNEEILLNDDYYITLGDNTNNSNDSRYFGYVKESRIYGKLLFRWFPFSRIGKVEK